MKTLNKIILLTLLLFAVIAFCAAETVPDVSVTVKNSKTKEAISYATVELLTPKDSVLTGGITNDKGFLTLPCTIDSAKIRIQFLGYKTYEATVANKNIGVVFLEDDDQLLKEVTVTGKAETNKVDRDVYVITKELKAGATLSRELLGKLNGVIYNPYDQSLMVNGSTNVLILVDGVEKDQNMAKNMSADRIDRVEIIKDPVGKYAADGYKAVINIITKKDYSGIDINAYSNSMFNLTNKASSPFLREEEDLYIGYTYKKLSLNFNYWGSQSALHVPGDYTKRYGDLLSTTAPMDYKNPNAANAGKYNNLNLGGDYQINTNNTVSLEVNYDFNVYTMNTFYNLTNYLDGTPISESSLAQNNRSTSDALRTTLTYHGKWNEKSDFEGDFRYLHSTPTSSSDFTQDALSGYSSNSRNEDYYRLNLDYTYQFNPKFSMNAAYGAVVDNYNLYQNDSTLTQKQLRNRISLYTSWNPVKQWSMKVGGIVEFFNQTYQGISQSDIVPMPFVNIQYKPIDKFSVTAKYHGQTPGYPSIDQLSPFTVRTDSLSWTVGNPELKFSNSQEVSLEFRLFQKFRIEPFYDFDHSSIQPYYWENNGQYFTGSINATKWDKYGVGADFTLPMLKQKLFWQNWMNAYITNISYQDVSSHYANFNFQSFLYYNIPKWDGSAILGVIKQLFKNPMLQGYNVWNNDMVIVIIQKNFFKKRLSIQLKYIPPFKFFDYEQGTFINTPAYSESSRYGIGEGLLKNDMFLQINYHFSAGKQVNVKKSSLEDDKSTKKGGGIL